MSLPPDDWKPTLTEIQPSDFAIARYDFNVSVPEGAKELEIRYGEIDSNGKNVLIRFGRWIF